MLEFPRMLCVNSRVILILLCLPAVPKVIDISYQRAIWFGEVVAWVPIIVTTEATHLVVVGTGGMKAKRLKDDSECLRKTLKAKYCLAHQEF